ncbi:phosphoribosylformylglycinamidine synthase subunit PurS, partial [Bacillus altitudinis]|uniref:phosphoribosylformylglycinamidine synthase subunit PurS n=1 Tax=Bacillus altitudinis TaxID=293387 RepID=UPI0011A9810B
TLLHPQPTALHHPFHSISYHQLNHLPIGKYIELVIHKSHPHLDTVLKQICKKFLPNTLIQHYRYHLHHLLPHSTFHSSSSLPLTLISICTIPFKITYLNKLNMYPTTKRLFIL